MAGRHHLEDQYGSHWVPNRVYRPDVPQRPGRTIEHLPMHTGPWGRSFFDPPPGRNDRSRFYSWRMDPYDAGL